MPEPKGPVGFWQPVTGGIYEGETPLDGCRREVFEETGQHVEPVEVRPGQDIVVHLPEFDIHKTLFLAFTRDRVIRTAPAEHDDHKWVSPDNVRSELYWESNMHTWDTVSRVIEAMHQG